MTAIGARYKWQEGKILHAAYLWQSPSKRRIPRIMVEERALEVGILVYLKERYMVFEETKQLAEKIESNGATKLNFYRNRFHLLPGVINEEDTYEWLRKGHKLLLWGKDRNYFVKPI